MALGQEVNVQIRWLRLFGWPRLSRLPKWFCLFAVLVLLVGGWTPDRTRKEQTELREWQVALTEEERHRVALLRQHLRGIVQEDLSDLEILGLSARSEAERSRYAKAFAHHYRKALAGVLAFDRAVVDEQHRLNAVAEKVRSGRSRGE